MLWFQISPDTVEGMGRPNNKMQSMSTRLTLVEIWGGFSELNSKMALQRFTEQLLEMETGFKVFKMTTNALLMESSSVLLSGTK